MANRATHLQIAKENEHALAAIQTESGVGRGWAATIAFYAAVHYVEAFLATKGRHSVDHRTRDSGLNENDETRAIYPEFSELKSLSFTARYQGKYPSRQELDTVVSPSLARVREELLKHFG